MTRKQMKKYAMELAQLEQTRSNEEATKEEKLAAEKRIMNLTNQIMMYKDGISALLEIDTMCQNILKSN